MKYLKFFEELFTRTKPSNSGSSVTRDIIIDDEPSSAKTLSSSILLDDKLRREELTSQIATISDADETPNDDVKLQNKNKRRWEKFKVTLNNLKFLKHQLKKNGILKCEYCDKTPLTIYDPFHKGKNKKYLKYNTDFKSSNGATADHKNPMAKGGDKFNFNNLAVSCMKCNHDKKEMDYGDWIEKIAKEKK